MENKSHFEKKVYFFFHNLWLKILLTLRLLSVWITIIVDYLYSPLNLFKFNCLSLIVCSIFCIVFFSCLTLHTLFHVFHTFFSRFYEMFSQRVCHHRHKRSWNSSSDFFYLIGQITNLYFLFQWMQAISSLKVWFNIF